MVFSSDKQCYYTARDGGETWDATTWTCVCGRGMAASLQYTGSRAVDSISIVRTYLYNRRNELSEVLVGTNAFGYAYDTIGNRTSDTLNGMSRIYAANCLNQYAQVDAAQMVYDADGNLVRDDRFAYAYDAENRMLSARPIVPPEGDLAEVNAYDHKLRRTVKRVERFDGEEWQTSETHTFAYDGSNIVLERITFTNGSMRTVEYFWGNDLSGSEQGAGGVGGLLATRIDGVFYIPVYGANGNVMMYVDAMGAIAAQFDYDPYGRVLAAPNYWENLWNFAFSTKYHDREADLIAYQLRTYDPIHGRWLNRDPIEEEGGVNLYVVCFNGVNCRIDDVGCAVFHSTVWGGVWDYDLTPVKPKPPRGEIPIVDGTFAESISEFIKGGGGAVCHYYYPRHSSTRRLLKHPEVAKVWKKFHDVSDMCFYSCSIKYSAGTMAFVADVVSQFDTNFFTGKHWFDNYMDCDWGYQVLGSFTGKYKITTDMYKCTKTLKMEIYNCWTVDSLTRIPGLSHIRKGGMFLLPDIVLERERAILGEVKQVYHFDVTEKFKCKSYESRVSCQQENWR